MWICKSLCFGIAATSALSKDRGNCLLGKMEMNDYILYMFTYVRVRGISAFKSYHEYLKLKYVCEFFFFFF